MAFEYVAYANVNDVLLWLTITYVCAARRTTPSKSINDNEKNWKMN